MTSTIPDSSSEERSFLLSYPRENVLRPVWRTMLTWIARRNVHLKNRQPLVSFTFDDFPRTALSTGGRILEDFGARGTYYTAMGLAGTTNFLGEHFVAEDLHELSAKGHELASHTLHHVSARDVAQRRFRAEASEGWEAIRTIPGLSPSRNFAYPFGTTNPILKKHIGATMSSCRGNFSGLNTAVTDLNLLRGNALYGDLRSLDRVKQLLEENKRANGWLIFYTHDVRENPSAFGCTPGLMQETLKLVVKQGCKVVRIQDVVEEAAPAGQQA